MKISIFPILSVLIIAGCASGPDYERPTANLPHDWPEQDILSQENFQQRTQWWQQFNDPYLNQLVAQALDQNLDIRIQIARVEEFRARLGLAKAGQLPTVEAQASASRERLGGQAIGNPGGRPVTTNIFSIAGMLGYEFDLWGRLAREREAAEAMLQQNTFARDAIELSILTDVVTTYFDLLAARNQLQITLQSVQTRAETLRLQQTRFDAGDIDRLSLLQAKSDWEMARSELPLRKQRLSILEGALAVLVGSNPAEIWQEMDIPKTAGTEIKLPEAIPVFLPAELLERRPDIRASEAGLIAAKANIGVTKAQRLPRINLSAMLGTAATSSGDLFTDPAGVWSLGVSLAGPIWDFGRSRSRTETAEALAEQAELQYRITTHYAFNDVRNALVIYQSSTERMDANHRAIKALTETRELAEIRYREGYIGLLELLDAERLLLSARLAQEEALRDQRTSIATLFKALGGGWHQP